MVSTPKKLSSLPPLKSNQSLNSSKDHWVIIIRRAGGETGAPESTVSATLTSRSSAYRWHPIWTVSTTKRPLTTLNSPAPMAKFFWETVLTEEIGMNTVTLAPRASAVFKPSFNPILELLLTTLPWMTSNSSAVNFSFYNTTFYAKKLLINQPTSNDN